MSDQEINIAMAEACGWKFDDSMEMWLSPNDIHFFPWQLPDYLNDLNAMHEAVAYLTPEQVNNFAVKLAQIVLENYCGGDVWWDLNANEVGHVANATARQRAEAFLRTIGKWKEGAK